MQKIVFNIMLSKILGGIEQSFLNYSEMLSKAGFKVINVITKEAPIKSYIKDENFVEISNQNMFDLEGKSQLKNLAKEHMPTYVICHGNRALTFAEEIKDVVDSDIIFVAHNYSLKNIHKASMIFAPTEHMLETLVVQGFDVDKIHIVPNSLKISSTEYKFKDYENKKYITIGSLGRFVKKKGFHVLIKAFHLLVKDNKNLKLVIAGSGEEEEYLKKYIQDLDLQEYASIIPWVDNKEDFFNKIDIFCLPSIHEPFGIVLLEAMLYNVPIVSTASEGPSFILKDCKNAVICDTESPFDLFMKLQFLLDRPELSKQIAFCAKNDLLNNYTLESVSNTLAKILSA
jgi:glycosyltransferase involved in cell wall biosynthesis